LATRAIVLAVGVLAAVAVADAVRTGPGDPASAPPARLAAEGEPLVEGRDAGFREDGPYLSTRVMSAGREYLSADAVADAFPVPVEGPHDISELAVAPDGTLVLAVYRLPTRGAARGALELWRGRRLVGAFAVPAGSLGGGLRFSRDGKLVATLSRDGNVAAVFDRGGRLVSTGELAALR
jgi:hypothetical protein